jgi:Phosphoserine phosphatase RsbU, N-terminal domain
VNSAQFSSRYAAALAQHLHDRNERSLHAAYELGREAVTLEVTLLDVAAAHHDVLREAIEAAQHDDTAELVAKSGDFLVETLAAYEMVHRGVPEVQNAAEADRRKIDLLRHLSGFLADSSLAVADEMAVRELLQLVAEHALEIVDAGACSINLDVPGLTSAPIAVEASTADVALHEVTPFDRTTHLRTPLLALDASILGWIEISSSRPLDEFAAGLLRQLAEMASATLERVLTYS